VTIVIAVRVVLLRPACLIHMHKCVFMAGKAD